MESYYSMETVERKNVCVFVSTVVLVFIGLTAGASILEQCNLICTKEYIPVCCTDGVKYTQYPNICVAEKRFKCLHPRKRKWWKISYIFFNNSAHYTGGFVINGNWGSIYWTFWVSCTRYFIYIYSYICYQKYNMLYKILRFFFHNKRLMQISTVNRRGEL